MRKLRNLVECGEILGEYGKSKDHRPDLKQMVVAAVLDGEGTPVCCELWPGKRDDKSLVGNRGFRKYLKGGDASSLTKRRSSKMHAMTKSGFCAPTPTYRRPRWP